MNELQTQRSCHAGAASRLQAPLNVCHIRVPDQEISRQSVSLAPAKNTAASNG